MNNAWWRPWYSWACRTVHFGGKYNEEEVGVKKTKSFIWEILLFLHLRYSALPSFEIFCSSEWMWVKLHKAHQQSVIILLHKAELHQVSAPVGGFICMQIKADWLVHVRGDVLWALSAWYNYIYIVCCCCYCVPSFKLSEVYPKSGRVPLF